MSTAARSRSSAPARRKANKQSLGPDQWDEWVEHLASRTNRPPLTELVPVAGTAPLRWALPNNVAGTPTESQLQQLERSSKSKAKARQLASSAAEWLEDAGDREASTSLGLEALAWAHALPRLSQLLPAAPWCELLEQLTEIARDASGIDLDDTPLAHQLIAGELPLTLSYHFSEIESCHELSKLARESLSYAIVELLDGEGLPSCQHLQHLRPLLACWARCLLLARASRQPCFDDDALNQYNWAVHQALRLTRHDGRQVLTPGSAGAWSAALFESAVVLGDDKEDGAIAAVALPSGGRASSSVSLPSAAIHSDWAETSVLRRGWDRSNDHLAITYGDGQLRGELNCGNATVFSGDLNPQLSINGKSAVFGEWTEVCWVSDHSVDYLELQCKLQSGLKLQRQMILGRQDCFLFMADAVLGSETVDIDYSWTLPLAEQVAFEPEDETREGALHGKRRLGVAIPLSLPEWQSESSDGELTATEHGLQFTMQRTAPRLYAPLFIDLDAKRSRRPLTWRRLTVAEGLEVVDDDVAVGYRVQVGKHQWMFYRSLAEVGNRTLLGQNYCSEFVAARFPASGEADKLIEIEL